MVKGFVEYKQFYIVSTALDTSLFQTTPSYVIIAAIVLIFIVVLGLLGIIAYYIYRKFNSIDIHTNKKYQDHNKDDKEDTYKDDKEELKKDVSELEAQLLPGGQAVINLVDIIKELKKK